MVEKWEITKGNKWEINKKCEKFLRNKWETAEKQLRNNWEMPRTGHHIYLFPNTV